MKHRPETSTSQWRTLRKLVLERDNYVCWMCGGKATSADHLRPVSRGGDVFDPRNLAAACKPCNDKKHNTWHESTGSTIVW